MIILFLFYSGWLLKSSSYDYIILGAGCAGLSLLMRLLRNEKLRDSRILVVDRDEKKQNDRTWCFWETGEGFFDDIVFRKWRKVSFYSSDYSASFDIDPYRYKMIRGIDFYHHCLNQLQGKANVDFVRGEVKKVSADQKGVTLVIGQQTFQLSPGIVFNSVYPAEPASPRSLQLLQHFKGWIVETPEPVFDPTVATMMDFRVHQQHGTTFAYCLPFSPTSALVEYTLFTKKLLQQEQYDEGLSNYLKQFIPADRFDIKEVEFGVIPMSDHHFRFYKDGVYYIGTAGGQTKASSGYTYQFIQKQSDVIIDHLVNGRPLNNLPVTPQRFRFYDRTLLHILYYEKLPGDKIFSRLFKRNKPQAVLKFLDNESSLTEELKIIGSLPTWPFLKAAISQL